jgi:cytochrome c-type biogenesis protein CcmH
MILFWLGAAALLILALAFVLPPLWGSGRSAPTMDGRRLNVGVYRSRLEELEQEHHLGMLSADDLEQAREELARELLNDTLDEGADDDRGGAIATDARPGTRLYLTITTALALPLVAVLLYQWLGEPRGLSVERAVPPAPAAQSGEHAGRGEMEEVVMKLAERLRAEPGNGDGWLLLGRSYMVLERHEQAALAFAEARRLRGDDADLLADLAEAEALADGKNFLGHPGELLEQSLALDPEHPKGLWLGAFAAMQRGEPELAASRWQKLLDRQPPDSEAAGILVGLIERTGTTPKKDTATAPASTGPALRVQVSIDESLTAGLRGDETVFVFARAVDGPPMPLAVVRRRVSDLPLTVELDDSTSMTSELTLSRFERVVVGARVSRDGAPIARSGDIQGFSDPVAVGATTPVPVTIDHVVP